MAAFNKGFQDAISRIAGSALGGTKLGGLVAKGVASMVEALLGGSARGTPQQMEAAESLLREAGYKVSPSGLIEPDLRPLAKPRQDYGPPATPSETLVPLGRRPTERATNQEMPSPGDEQPFGVEILTPYSSNVYSFSYHPGTETLYVTFQSHVVHPDAVTRTAGRKGGKHQLRGRLGGTVGRKTGDRGSMYAYLRVPPGVYDNMKAAASKGKFVWDALRIRGTIYGHQYAYQLVQGQVTPSVGGVYIPRKATREGFRVRSVAEIGTGRRGFQSSTLPEQKGFRTRSR